MLIYQDKLEQLKQARFLFNDPAWKDVSAGGKDFVRGLLKKQPGFRWTAREALDHCADTWGPTFVVGSRTGGGGGGWVGGEEPYRWWGRGGGGGTRF